MRRTSPGPCLTALGQQAIHLPQVRFVARAVACRRWRSRSAHAKRRRRPRPRAQARRGRRPAHVGPGQDGTVGRCECGCGTPNEQLRPHARYLNHAHRQRAYDRQKVSETGDPTQTPGSDPLTVSETQDPPQMTPEQMQARLDALAREFDARGSTTAMRRRAGRSPTRSDRSARDGCRGMSGDVAGQRPGLTGCARPGHLRMLGECCGRSARG